MRYGMARRRDASQKFGYPTGEGVWDKRPSGMRVRFSLGCDPDTGKRVLSRGVTVDIESQFTKSGKRLNDKAKMAAERLRQELIAEYEAKLQEADENASPTLSEYAEGWRRRREVDPLIKKSTQERYVPALKRIDKHLGRYRLNEITVRLIRETYSRLLTEEGLTPCMLNMMHRALGMILDEAEADEYIAANPTRNKTIKVPSVRSTSRKSLTIGQAQDLLKLAIEHIEDNRFLGIVIALETGMRRGEVLGLIWENVHFEDDPFIDVRWQLQDKATGLEPPKADSYRRIYISHELAGILKDWKAIQAQRMEETSHVRKMMREERQQEKWKDGGRNRSPANSLSYSHLQTDRTTVIVDELFEPRDPDNFARWFRSVCVKYGYGRLVDEEGETYEQRYNEKGTPVDETGRPYSRMNHKKKRKLRYEGLKFHELRHSSISILLARGVDVKTVMDRAGHKKMSTTNLYAHPVSQENSKKAAQVIGSALGGV